MADNSKPIANAIDKMIKAGGKHSPAVMKIFDSWVAELDNGGLPANLMTAGSAFPDGDLLDAHGQPTSLKQTLNSQTGVIVFYRGAWCPYCNLALKIYQKDLLPELNKLGVKLVAISPQRADGSMTMKDKNDLDFAVLSDPGNQIAEQLGIIIIPPAKVQAAQKSFGLDLTAVNADHSAFLPMPTVAIVDHGGTLVWIDVHPNYKTRTEPGDVLEAIKTHLKFD